MKERKVQELVTVHEFKHQFRHRTFLYMTYIMLYIENLYTYYTFTTSVDVIHVQPPIDVIQVSKVVDVIYMDETHA